MKPSVSSDVSPVTAASRVGRRICAGDINLRSSSLCACSTVPCSDQVPGQGQREEGETWPD